QQALLSLLITGAFWCTFPKWALFWPFPASSANGTLGGVFQCDQNALRFAPYSELQKVSKKRVNWALQKQIGPPWDEFASHRGRAGRVRTRLSIAF
ncbi:hypothetical protein C2E23DRAFT_827396, partial [Lenzites betulinus]